MNVVLIIIALVLGIAGGAGGILVYNKKNENGGKTKAEHCPGRQEHRHRMCDHFVAIERQDTESTKRATFTPIKFRPECLGSIFKHWDIPLLSHF